MRILLSCIIVMCMLPQAMAQVKIGDNPGTINGASLLELESKIGTFVIPRMTSTDRDALSSPLPGSQIYNTTKQCVDLFDGTTWDCIAAQSDQSDNQQVTIQGTNLLLERGGSVDLSTFLDNTDNQQISSFTFNALTFELAITLEAGGTQFVDLSALNNSGTDDQNLTGATLTGTDLEIGIEGGTSTTADLSALEESADIAAVATELATHLAADKDIDETNELINSAALNGTDLEIVDAGGTTTVDLSVLNDAGTDNQNLTSATIDASNILTIAIEDGNPVTVDLSNYLDNTDDQNLASATIDGSNVLTIAIEGGNPVTVDLSAYLDNTDDQNLTGATLTGTDLQIDIENGTSTTADLSALEESADIAAVATDLAAHEAADGDLSSTNELITEAILDGTDLKITEAGVTRTIALASFVSSDDQTLSDFELNGDTLTITLEDGGTVNVDLSDLEESADIAQVATDLATHVAADNDLDNMNEVNTSATLNGSNLEIVDAGGSKTADLSALEESADIAAVATDLAAHEAADGDLSSTNELITEAVLDGTDLKITEAGVTRTIALASFVSSDDQTLSDFELNGNTLTITLEDGGTVNVDLSDLEESADIAQVATDLATHVAADNDLDNLNEVNTSATLNGSNLEIVDAGGTKTADLSALEESADIAAVATDLAAHVTADEDTDKTNELITEAVLDGTDLKITEAGVTRTIALASFVSSDDQTLSDFELNGNTLTITLEDGGTVNVDLSDLEESADIAQVATDLATHVAADNDLDNMNEVNTSATLNGSNLEIVDAGGTKTADLSALEESADIAAVATDLAAHEAADGDLSSTNELITEAVLDGTDLKITEAGMTRTIALASFVSSDDQQITDLSISGNTLSITLEDGGTKMVDLSALDDSGSDNQALSLTGTTLNLSNGGTVDLSDLEESADIAQVATDLATHVAADNDLDNMNEVNTSATLNGSNLEIVDAGGTKTADLSALEESADIAAVATDLAAHEAADGDLSSTNELITEAVLDGTDLKITEAGVTRTIALASFVSSDDQTLSDFELNGNTLTITLEDGGTVNVDLSDLEESADIAQVATDLATHVAADNDLDNMNEVNTSVTLNGSNLEIVDAGGTKTADLSALEESADIAAVATDLAAHEAADGDLSSTNELITEAVLDGTDLKITEAGVTRTIALASFVSSDDQTLSDFELNGNTLTITLEDGGTVNVDLSDLEESADIAQVATDLATHVAADNDLDNLNEVNTSATLNGSNLEIVDAGGTKTADLSALEESADIAAVATDLAAHVTADEDTDKTNELITEAVLDGTDLKITEAGVTRTIALASFVSSDDQTLSDFELNGNTLTITLEDGGTVNVDLSDLEESADIAQVATDLATHVAADNDLDNMNEVNTSATLNGSNLEIVDAGGTKTADLSALEESADIAAVATDLAAHEAADGDLSSTNELITEAVLDGTDLKITEAGMTRTIALASFVSSDDQQITDLSISGNTLSITLEDGGTKMVDLSALDDSGSDNQALSLTGTTLNLSNGGTVDLSDLEESADIAQVATDLATHVAADNDLDNMNEVNTSATLNGSNLEIVDAGGTKTADLSALEESADIAAVATDLAAHEAADGDLSSTNELITEAVLDGTDLKITEAGVTRTIALASFVSSDDQTLSDFELNGNTLTITLEDGGTVNVDLSDLEESADIAQVATDLATHVAADNDLDNMNEVNTSATLNGSNLEIVDAGGTKTADLSALEESADIAAVATDLAAHVTADEDTDKTNELITEAVLDGTDLKITEAGVIRTIALASFVSSDDQTLSDFELNGNTLTITLEDGGTVNVDLSDLEESADIAQVATDLATHVAADNDLDNMNEINTSATLNGSNLEIVDAGGTKTADLSALEESADIAAVATDLAAHEAADGDLSSTNELITEAVLDGTDLQITEAGVTRTIALASFVSSDDQTLSDFELNGNTLTITLEDGGTVNVDLSDLEESADIAQVATDLATHVAADNDLDNMNEVNTSATLNGSNLEIVDAGGTKTADLSALEESADIAAVATDLAAHVTADEDTDKTNELITEAVLDGTDLKITEAGVTRTIALASFVSSDDQTLSDFELNGNTLTITLEDGGTVNVDLSDLEESADIAQVATDLATHVAADNDLDNMNEVNTSATLNGSNLEIVDAGGTKTADLSALEESADIAAVATDLAAHEAADGDLSSTNELITEAVLDGTDLKITEAGVTRTIALASFVSSDDQTLSDFELNGNTLTITLEDGGTVNVDLSDLEESADIAQVATDLATHVAADNDLDNMNEVNTSATLNGSNLEIVDAGGTKTADLSALEESADIAAVATDLAAHEAADGDLSSTNELITEAVLDGTDLKITEAGVTRTIPLASFVNTDDQKLTLVSNKLTVEDGGSVDLAPYLDNTDDQNLKLDDSIDELTIEDGNTVKLGKYLDNTDDQELKFDDANDELFIENGNSVKLSKYLNTDDQNLTAATLTGTDLKIDIEDGNSVTADLSKLRSKVTQVVTTGNTIATHNDGATTTNIIETTTTLVQNDADPTGKITYTNEAGTQTLAHVVAAETNNEITVGANGGAFFMSPVRAMGKVNADGSTNKDPYNATVSRTARGVYLVTLAAEAEIADANYIIQLTVRDSEGAGNDDYDVSYRMQTATTFIVEVGDNDNGGSDRASADFEFMFTVLAYK